MQVIVKMTKPGMTMEMDEPFYVRKRPDPVPFHKVLWNREKGTVLGRTGISWGKFWANVGIPFIIIDKRKSPSIHWKFLA